MASRVQSLPRDSFVLIAFAAVVVHLIFKRWEPMHIAVVSTLLLLLPATLSTILISHYAILQALGLGLLTFHTTLVTSITLYRISPFHPLARYPGPLLARVSKLWHVWKSWEGKQYLYIQGLHNKYGDIVRIGPNEVSIRDASCIAAVLGAEGMPKGPMFTGRHLWPKMPSVIGVRDPAEHQRRRRPWNRAFNSASVKEFVPTIQHRVHLLGEALAARQGQVLDLAEWMSFFTYDFMGDMAFGGWTEMVKEGGDYNGIWAIVKFGVKTSFVYEHVPWLSYYTKNLPGFSKDVQLMQKMAFTRTHQRYDAGSSSRDLFYYLSNEDGSEKVSPPQHVVTSDGLTALLAGSDTTATVLSSIMYCLMRNPAAYKRVQEEVDKFYPVGEDSLDPKHIPEMRFLEAVIMEGLRVFPAVPSGSQRAPQVGKGGRMVGNYYIPEGTQTRIHFWSVHHDARNFSHPDTFWPDRWLIASGAQSHHKPLVHNAAAWLPFSFGPASCVGKSVAMQEMRQVLCHLVRTLDFRFADEDAGMGYEREMEDRFVTTVGRLWVVVGCREH